jgi:hypothetical protein
MNNEELFRNEKGGQKRWQKEEEEEVAQKGGNGDKLLLVCMGKVSLDLDGENYSDIDNPTNLGNMGEECGKKREIEGLNKLIFKFRN